jgi:glycosyltransferase involved in cell wall biosynthesis
MEHWVLIAGGFHRHGGMDRCNWALARYLIDLGKRVHLVTHSADPALKEKGTVYLVGKPANSFFLGEFLLARRGREVAGKLTARWPRTRVVANGGNCGWPDINWVHFVHSAWTCRASCPISFRAKDRIARLIALRAERSALQSARVIVANSERTRSDLIRHLAIDPSRVHTIYPGTDPGVRPPNRKSRWAARTWLRIDEARPLVAFVGALGYDSRKGMDVLFNAWRRLCARPDWDADLLVAGGGRALPAWRRQIAQAGLDDRIRLAGFVDRIPEMLAAADLLVSPVRYEAYGLNVHEAICCGVPAMVTKTAGVAERYPAELRPLLIEDPEDVDALVAKLLRWRMAMDYWREKIAPFSQELRSYTLDDMAKRMVAVCTEDPRVDSAAAQRR